MAKLNQIAVMGKVRMHTHDQDDALAFAKWFSDYKRDNGPVAATDLLAKESINTLIQKHKDGELD